MVCKVKISQRGLAFRATVRLWRQRFLGLRGDSFRSVPELIEAIYEYLNSHNHNPRAFVWSASVEPIPAKIGKCKEAFDALRWDHR